jgi:hypothetical protein
MVAALTAVGPVVGANPQINLIVDKDELPQTKLVVKPTQLAEIEGVHLHGRHIIHNVTDTEVVPWVKFPPKQLLSQRDAIQLAI